MSKSDEIVGEGLESADNLVMPRGQELTNNGERALNLGLYRFFVRYYLLHTKKL